MTVVAGPVKSKLPTAPKLRRFPKRRDSLVAVGALSQLMERECSLRRRDARRFVIGWVIVAGAVLAFTAFGLTYISIGAPGSPPLGFARAMGVVGSVLVACTFPIALLTRKASRADMVDEFLNHGSRSSGGNDDPFIRLLLTIAMAGSLYGEFLVIDAVKSWWVRVRLRTVDRYRAATVLGSLMTNHAGIDPRMLLRHGESPLALRRTIAYLLACEWADISPAGDHLLLLSPARRALRESAFIAM
jgi:hypothetical protein